jgi:hypothetical protein
MSGAILNELIELVAHTVLRDAVKDISTTKWYSILCDETRDGCLRYTKFPKTQCRGQGYDGASNFQGRVSGVAKSIQKEVPYALSVHCLAHCLNLTLQDTAKQCMSIQDALDFATELVKLFKNSLPKGKSFLST